MKEGTRTLWGKLSLFSAALIWGGSFVIVKNALDSVPALRLIALRMSVAALLLFVLSFKKWRSLRPKTFLHGGIAGLFMFAGALFQTLGLRDTTPGKSAFLTATYCVLVPFFSWFVYKKRPDARHFAAALLALVGIGFIALDAKLTMGRGDMLTLLCGVSYACHILSIDKFGPGEDPVVFVTLQCATCAVLSWTLSLAAGEPSVAFGWSVIWPLLYLGAAASAGATLFQNLGQRRVEPSVAALICSLESVFAVVFSLLFYPDERLTLPVAAGFLIVFCAVVLSQITLPARAGALSARKGD